MVDRPVREAPTHREAGMAGPDETVVVRTAHLTQGYVFRSADLDRTSVGLVITSKTAERFCDCATSA